MSFSFADDLNARSIRKYQKINVPTTKMVSLAKPKGFSYQYVLSLSLSLALSLSPDTLTNV